MIKLRNLAILLFVAISLIPISFLSYYYLQSLEKEITAHTFMHLNSVASLIENQVNAEIEKQILVSDLFSSRLLLRTSLEDFNNQQNELSQNQISKIINDALKSRANLEEIHIFSNDFYLVSSTKYQNNEEYYKNYQFTDLSKVKKIDFKLSYHQQDENFHLILTSPLFNNKNNLIGYAVLIFHPSELFIYNSIPGLGETGEYIIAKRDQNGDAVFITPPRHISSDVLIHKVSKDRPDIPITQALLKNPNFFEDKVDYRGTPILAVTKYISETDWGVVVKIDKSEAYLPIEILKYNTLLIIGIIFAVMIIVSAGLSNRYSNIIKKISTTTKNIVDEVHSKPLEGNRIDEINQMSKDINAMADSLKQQRKELIKNERLSAIGNIASRITHDLKNPLTVLKISTDAFLLRHKNDLNEEDRNTFKRIQSSNSRLERQVNEILDFVKNKPLDKKTNKLSNLLSESIDSIEVSKDVKIHLPQNDVEVNCESTKMESVFINLLTNAIQSIDGKGEINIQCSEDKNNIIIEFIDTGKGISEDIKTSIFDTLFTTKITGTGLGLATCKNIIEQHGGTISVKNNPTTFTIVLPK